MKGYNHVTLVGNLSSSPELSKVGDLERTVFTLAVNRSYTALGKVSADFIPIVSWGKLAIICNDYLEKGRRVLVDGRICVRDYEEDGHAKWITEIVADEVTILSPPKER